MRRPGLPDASARLGLNNSAQHGVWSCHPSLSRTHLICDFLPTPELKVVDLRGRSRAWATDWRGRTHFAHLVLTSVIATGDFVFLHLQNRVEPSVSEWLLRFFPGSQNRIPSAAPARSRRVQKSSRARPGSQSGSYYVSWYAFQSGLARPNALFEALSVGGTLGFEGTNPDMLSL